MTQEEKMKALEKALDNKCSYGDCVDCEFFEPEDATDGDNFCGIRDKKDRVPYHKGWNMKEALGIGEYKTVSLSDNIANSIMNHFTRRE